jgi:ubiquinone/menaquinone biosynthesis C-methylase UbiE
MSQTKEPPHYRTLAADIPELMPFLKSGMKVLDVGCGFGTITMGVAEVVAPGEVVGLDPGKTYIDGAREWAAANPHISNITFHVGDSHHLEFPDNTFNVVYSNTVLHFFLDPVLGLKEQKRVTKPGGWVIGSGVRDYIIFRYPSCPHWDKVCNAFRRYTVTFLRDYQASGKDPIQFFKEHDESSASGMFYANMHAGRRCREWFHQAGLADVHLQIQPRRLKYQGQQGMKPDIYDMMVIDEPTTEQHRFMEDMLQRMIAMKLLDDKTLEQAKVEARTWYRHPGAFQFWPEIFAAGRVK